MKYSQGGRWGGMRFPNAPMGKKRGADYSPAQHNETHA